MNYLDDLAEQIAAHVPAADIPADDTTSLFRLYAVLLLAKGEAVSAADVHNAWAAWMTDQEGDHDALVPFDELPPATIAEDEPFATAIRAVARLRGPVARRE